MSSVICSLESPDKCSRLVTRVPSHLYKRNGLYYFRVVFPDKLRQRFDRCELRISLRTAYRRNALELSWRLHVCLQALIEGEAMLTYKEIRRRLNVYLQCQLERDHYNIFARSSIKERSMLVANPPDYTETDIPSIREYSMFMETPPDYTETDIYKHNAESLQTAIRDPEILKLWTGIAAKALVRDGVFLADEINDSNHLDIAKAYLENQVTYYRLMEKRSQGDYLTEEAIVSADFGGLPIPPGLAEEFEKLVREKERLLMKKNERQAAKQSAENQGPNSRPHIRASMPYSEAMQVFIKDKLAEKRWKPHMLSEHEGQLQMFLDVMGDMEIDKITRGTIRGYRDTLSALPPNYTRVAKYKGKTIPEILAMAPKKVLSVVRVNTLIQAVSSLMDWFVGEGIIQINPATRLQQQEDRQAIDLRLPFEKKDLEKIFSHPKFTEGKFKFVDYFWPPLIALFSGMRLEEICQLHCKDVYETNGIWVIDINDNDLDEDGRRKTLKNPNARRLVPVHSALIDLGFLLYVEHISSKNNIRLFPNLNKSDKVGKYGKQVGKQFNDLVKSALSAPGYTSDTKTFHSLRHNFADFYKQRGLQTDEFRQLYGHDIPELAARQYGSRFPVKLLFEVISKLDYDLDLSFLKKSKYIRELPADEPKRG